MAPNRQRVFKGLNALQAVESEKSEQKKQKSQPSNMGQSCFLDLTKDNMSRTLHHCTGPEESGLLLRGQLLILFLSQWQQLSKYFY